MKTIRVTLNIDELGGGGIQEQASALVDLMESLEGLGISVQGFRLVGEDEKPLYEKLCEYGAPVEWVSEDFIQ